LFRADGFDTLSLRGSSEVGMAEIVGTGDFKYRIVENWAKLPDGWSFKEVAAVAVDNKDNVYAFTRGEHPIIVFDRDGNFLRSWGEGQYPRAHGIHMGPDDLVYLTDDGGHFVRKCSLDGKLLLEIGVPGKPAPYMSGEPFHRCTHTALSPKGEIYVSDGYGNARVHKYSPDGKLLMSWGEPGTGPGEFNIVHNICTDADGWVYVADRENHRLQVFDGNGKYETQWNNLHRPCGLYMDYMRHPVCYIGELGPSMAVNRNSPNLGPRVSIVDHQGKLLSRFGDAHAGLGPTAFIGPHGMCADSHGDLYVGEVAWTLWPGTFPDQPRPDNIRCFRKFEKVR
jgi:outer membrane protein assembly factor BamB